MGGRGPSDGLDTEPAGLVPLPPAVLGHPAPDLAVHEVRPVDRRGLLGCVAEGPGVRGRDGPTPAGDRPGRPTVSEVPRGDEAGPRHPRRLVGQRQLAAGVVAFDRAPYDSVLMHGWVNGPDGRQMHKSLGNIIEPETIVRKFGVDALRFYMLSVNAIWDDKTFQEDGVRNANRTLNILWNVLRFATTYMVLDRFDPASPDFASISGHLRPEDRWLLSRLEGLKSAVNKEFATYHLHRAYRAVESFILDDLSRWYVKLVRGRTWTEAEDRDKLAAYHVLFEALRTLALLLAPATPFVAEAIYQRLDGKKLSVHMVDWPSAREERIQPDIERSMGIVQELVEVVSKERQKGGRKLRWPLKLVAVKSPTPDAAAALETLRGIFLEQANAKTLAVLKETEEFPGMALVVKPDPAAIGKAYRVLQPKIVKLLETRSADEIKKALDKGHLQVGVEGQIVTIEPSMVPYAREIIRRIQQMRKDIDLDVDDFIETVVKTSKDFATMLGSQKEFMARETRSRKFTFAEGTVESEYVVEWNDVDGHSVTIGVTPLHMSEALRDFTRIPGITVPKAMALFDAGYKSRGALQAATKQELAQIEGLQGADAVRILDALAATKEVPFSCPTCGASVSASARRCSRCGEPVTTKTTPCPRCKAAIPPGAEKCPVCGFVLSTASVGSPSRIACIACGELIPAGSTECPSCGAPQARAASTPARTSSEDEPPPLLKDSSSYLVEEAAPDEAYRLFQIAQKAGKPGMAITRIFPQKVRERLGGSDLPILWLSNVGKEDSVRPKDLEKLSLAVEQFLTREKGVILLDAIEYLVTNNNFITVLRLVQSIRDQVAINNGVFLVSVNPSALDPHQLTLLEREVDRVIGSRGGSSGETSRDADR
ncbi:MAG: DUF835 domain-containing protein [Methanobacteriota archaeon]|nr:MAG: DUF835 domain-containing protein [Euryarchaeota archaeon]